MIWENWELRNNGDWGEWGAGMDRSRRGGMKDGDIAPKKSQEKFKTARTVQKPKNSMEIQISHIYRPLCMGRSRPGRSRPGARSEVQAIRRLAPPYGLAPP